ncbi:MAG: hypothetical protein ACREID_09330, partial [Planctomycetota bacterium]
VGADSGWTAVGLSVVLAASASYLRTGIEVGAMEARCKILAPKGLRPSEPLPSLAAPTVLPSA